MNFATILYTFLKQIKSRWFRLPFLNPLHSLPFLPSLYSPLKLRGDKGELNGGEGGEGDFGFFHDLCDNTMDMPERLKPARGFWQRINNCGVGRASHFPDKIYGTQRIYHRFGPG